MNRKLKSISCFLAATCTFLVLENTIKLGPLGVDVVSAASETAPATTTSTTSSTSTNGYRVLRIGSTGTDVKFLQTALNNNGSKLTVDGFFGNLTLAAVKDYQKAQGLVVDGIVGPKTMAVLVPSSAVPTGISKIGSSSDDVKYLQTNLNKLGYKLSVDGIFGNLTLAAVKDFQKANALVVDGIAGPKTFGKLFEKVTTPASTPTTSTTTTTPVDTVTSASQVNDEATFAKNIADPNSDYMQIVNKNLTFDKDLTVVSGTKPASTNATTGAITPAAPNRSIAPAAEDATGKVTNRYSITVPNLVLSGLTEKIEYGIINGNVYVQNTGFTLKDATINGNLYFATQTLMDAYNALTPAINKGTVTGIIAVKTYTTPVDAVASASQVNDEANFEQKIAGSNRDYMIIVNKNLNFTKDLIVESGIKPGANGAVGSPNRSIAPAAEDATGKVTSRYSITVPKLVLTGMNEKVEYGIINGDIYVQNTGFTFKDATINGNLYFATQALMDAYNALTPVINKGTVNGSIAVKTYK